MKRFLVLLLSLALLMTSAYVFGCKKPDNDGANVVKLIPLSDGTAVNPGADCDYFVVPEPAATTKQNATGGALAIAGSLQELYGGQNGYPQAVLVAKKTVIEENPSAVSALVSSFAENASWLTASGTSTTDIVSAVKSGFVDQEMAPTFTANNLSLAVIQNCAIGFKSAAEEKQAVLSFMAKFNAISNNAWGTPADEFFYTPNASAQSLYASENSSANLSLYVPDGAPALSVARLLHDETAINGVDVNVVSANVIQTYVTGESPTADFCIMPVNAATKFLGTANRYQMLGVVTHGNLFLMKKQGAPDINAGNIDTLKGKKVGVLNMANVPGLTFKVILKDFGLIYQEATTN